MKYSVVVARRIYEELRDKLPKPSGRMGEHLRFVVDDAERAVIEARLPGRVRWEAHTIPRIPAARSLET